jgi:hypothetical protein
MVDAASRIRGARALLATVAVLSLGAVQAHGQGGRGPAGPPPTAKASAPFDLTGYWVSAITQNWRLRMVTPPRGDYMGIPMTVESKMIADAWDPAKDEAAGNQCKYYGAATIMTLPERLHITWQDDSTLRMDIDAGTQTRVFSFADRKAPEGKARWQGDSVAAWVSRRSPASTPPAMSRYLKVTTHHMLSGYLRKNGVPYSEQAVLTEYYDPIREPDGEMWMIVTTIVEDPVFLENPLILTAQFKKQSDASGWEPTPCSARW